MLFQYPEFEKLIGEVQACRTCLRMCDSVRVLSRANGDPAAQVMFIGEAPGRLGADRTSIPFHGDKAGDNFERLLAFARLRRSQVFITNAVLCNPRTEEGNNAPPTLEEITNCVRHLRRQIEIIQPLLVMTLGSVALEATRAIESHQLALRDSVRSAHPWFGRLLLPLYHPGARAMIHRSFVNQTSDYYFVGETFRRVTKQQRRNKTRLTTIRAENREWNLVRYVLRGAGPVSLFRLHKLIYLIDLKSIERLGHRATSFLFLRQKDGPYCVELGSRWHQNFDVDLRVRKISGKLVYELPSAGLFQNSASVGSLDRQLTQMIDEILASTAGISDAQLKTRVYLTTPMKKILQAEKAGAQMLNHPLLSDAA